MAQPLSDSLRVALLAAAALEACGIRYVVGGSVASGLVGEPRSTLDVDMAVELSLAQSALLGEALGAEFYFDPVQAGEAVRRGSSTSAIHEPSGVKVDFFMSASAFDRRQMERRRRVAIGDEGEWLYVCAAEDILLQKLRWYQRGGGVSDRQWRDVLGIALVQGAALDRRLLATEAEDLGVADLLRRALAQADRELPAEP